MSKYLAGALALIAVTIFEFLVQYSFLDFIQSKLRAKGPQGALVASFLTSPVVLLALLVTACVLSYKAIQETRKNKGKKIVEHEEWVPLLPAHERGRRQAPIQIINSPTFNNAPHIEQHPIVNQTPVINQAAYQAARLEPITLNFECLRPGVAKVEFDSRWSEVVGIRHVDNDVVDAAVAEIRRNVDEPLVNWIDLKFRVEIKAPDKEPILIHEGRWIHTDYEIRELASANFKIQSVRRFVVALINDGRAVTYEGRYRDTGHHGIKIFEAEFQPLPDPVYDVDVYLFGTKTRPPVTVNEVFRFELRIADMVFRPRG